MGTGVGGGDDARVAAHAMYAIYAVSVFTGIPLFVGAIIAFLARGRAEGTIYRSHLAWGLTTFWVVLILGAIGTVLALVLVGYLILIPLWLWFVYRTVRGWWLLSHGHPAPATRI